MTEFTDAAPVLCVRNIDTAVDHYRRLGFAVRRYEGAAPYAYADRDSVHLHLSQFAGLRPEDSTSLAYIFVDDADALFAEWKACGAAGRFDEPVDTEWGRREGAHIDPDGNLLRFGSPLA